METYRLRGDRTYQCIVHQDAAADHIVEAGEVQEDGEEARDDGDEDGAEVGHAESAELRERFME